jgi:hypothetical protein
MGPLIILVAEVPGAGFSGYYLTIGAFGTLSNVLEFSGQWQYHFGTNTDCSNPITLSNPVFESSTTDGDNRASHPATLTVTPQF